MIIYNAHIGRTAGTTLGYVFKRNHGQEYLKLGSKEITKFYSKDRTSPVTPLLTNHELNYIINNVNIIPKVISSHYLPLPDATQVLQKHFTEVKLTTFLRDPIERVISHYFMFRNKRLSENILPQHIKYDYRNNMNNFFKNYEYVSSKYPVRNPAKNHQTFTINNSLNINEAISTLRNDYWFIGILERFDEALLLLKDQYKKLGKDLNIMYMRQQVVSRNFNEQKTLVTDKIRQDINDMNKLDQKLYNAANQIFEERIKLYSGDLAADLHEFQTKLQRWQHYQKYVPHKAKKLFGWTRNKLSMYY